MPHAPGSASAALQQGPGSASSDPVHADTPASVQSLSVPPGSASATNQDTAHSILPPKPPGPHADSPRRGRDKIGGLKEGLLPVVASIGAHPRAAPLLARRSGGIWLVQSSPQVVVQCVGLKRLRRILEITTQTCTLNDFRHVREWVWIGGFTVENETVTKATLNALALTMLFNHAVHRCNRLSSFGISIGGQQCLPLSIGHGVILSIATDKRLWPVVSVESESFQVPGIVHCSPPSLYVYIPQKINVLPAWLRSSVAALRINQAELSLIWQLLTRQPMCLKHCWACRRNERCSKKCGACRMMHFCSVACHARFYRIPFCKKACRLLRNVYSLHFVLAEWRLVKQKITQDAQAGRETNYYQALNVLFAQTLDYSVEQPVALV